MPAKAIAVVGRGDTSLPSVPRSELLIGMGDTTWAKIINGMKENKSGLVHISRSKNSLACLARAHPGPPVHQDLGCFTDHRNDRVLDLASVCEPGQRTMSPAVGPWTWTKRAKELTSV